MNNAAAGSGGPLALICGGGTLPLAVADSAAKPGAIGCAVSDFAAMPSPRWLRVIRIIGFGLGNLEHLRGLRRAAGCRDVVWIGVW